MARPEGGEGVPPRSLWASFQRTTAAVPGKAAIIEEEREIDYAELDRRARALAGALARAGGQGCTMCLLMRSGIPYVASVLAITSLRGVFAPLDVDWPAQRLQAMLDLAAPWAIVATPEYIGLARILAGADAAAPRVVALDDEGRLADESPGGKAFAAPSEASDNAWAEDPLYLIYTSGSTGEPNAVVGIHGSLAHFIGWQAACYGIDAAARVAQLAPTTFDVHLRDLFLPLYVGATLYVPRHATRRNPVRLRRWLCRHRITVIHSVPSLFRMLVEDQAGADTLAESALEVVFLSGEQLLAIDAAAFQEALPAAAQLVNFYGPSECTLIKTHYRIPRPYPAEPGGSVPIGGPIDGCEVVVVDGDRLCRPMEVGEIRLRSDFLARGYLGNPELTARKFATVSDRAGRRTREYRTGDLGYFDAAGCLHFVGRRDHQVKLDGNRVELAEVELGVRALPEVRDAAIVALAAGDGLILGCAYVGQARLDPAEIRRRLSERLPRYMVPARFLEVAGLPLLANGKIDRRRIAQMFEG